MIVTVWIKNLTIKVAFEGKDHIMTKVCNSENELKDCWNTVQALCHGMGSEIKLK